MPFQDRFQHNVAVGLSRLTAHERKDRPKKVGIRPGSKKRCVQLKTPEGTNRYFHVYATDDNDALVQAWARYRDWHYPDNELPPAWAKPEFLK